MLLFFSIFFGPATISARPASTYQHSPTGLSQKKKKVVIKAELFHHFKLQFEPSIQMKKYELEWAYSNSKYSTSFQDYLLIDQIILPSQL